MVRRVLNAQTAVSEQLTACFAVSSNSHQKNAQLSSLIAEIRVLADAFVMLRDDASKLCED